MHPKNVKQNKQHIASLENNLEAGDVSLWMPGSLFHERPAADLTLTNQTMVAAMNDRLTYRSLVLNMNSNKPYRAEFAAQSDSPLMV